MLKFLKLDIQIKAAIALALLSAALPVQAFAQPRVVLITSMAMPKNPGALNASYFEMAPYRLEKTFRKFFANLPGFELVVMHGADAFQTWSALKSPDNAAVFWVSHAGNFGLFGGDVLTDVKGRNVAPVFQWVHPNTRALALVGCTTNPILKRMNEQGYFRDNYGMTLLGTNAVVEARPALKDALEAALPALLTASNSFPEKPTHCPKRQGFPVVITRRLDPSIAKGVQTPPVRVEVGGKLAAVLPGGDAGQQSAFRIWIETPASGKITASQLKFVFSTGAGADESDTRLVGRYEIEAPWTGARWKLFTKPGTDEPMGVTGIVYQYKGTLQLEKNPSEYRPQRCE